jgi:hypothetical protein
VGDQSWVILRVRRRQISAEIFRMMSAGTELNGRCQPFQNSDFQCFQQLQGLKQLEKDLSKVSGNISAVVNALITIVQDDYIGRQLASEEQKLADRYLEFAKDKSPEVKLLLDDRWHADEQALAAKRASAQSLITALQALSKGFADLAANAHQLKAREIRGLLGPYVTQLQTLIPQIQKGF